MCCWGRGGSSAGCDLARNPAPGHPQVASRQGLSLLAIPVTLGMIMETVAVSVGWSLHSARGTRKVVAGDAPKVGASAGTD